MARVVVISAVIEELLLYEVAFLEVYERAWLLAGHPLSICDFWREA